MTHTIPMDDSPSTGGNDDSYSYTAPSQLTDEQWQERRDGMNKRVVEYNNRTVSLAEEVKLAIGRKQGTPHTAKLTLLEITYNTLLGYIKVNDGVRKVNEIYKTHPEVSALGGVQKFKSAVSIFSTSTEPTRNETDALVKKCWAHITKAPMTTEYKEDPAIKLNIYEQTDDRFKEMVKLNNDGAGPSRNRR